jgi:hypothetical protein
VVITLSLVVFLGFLLALMLRVKILGGGGAFVAVMFGYFLASTAAAAPIGQLTASVVQAVSDLSR